MLRRIEAMAGLGHHVMLLTSDTQNNIVSEKEASDYLISKGIQWNRIRRCGYLALLWQILREFGRTPIFVIRRLPFGSRRKRLIETVGRFQPDIVWLEGPWLSPLAQDLKSALGVPVAYRSHNVEYRYMRAQRHLTAGLLRRALIGFSFYGLERFERSAMAGANNIYDISLDDLKIWKFPNAKWLPPLMGETPSVLPAIAPGLRVVFVGNLKTPNNIRGVEWVLRDVMPLVLAACGDVQFQIVGSGPSPELREMISSSGCQLLADVPNVLEYMNTATVLINPVAAGSGVQLKMLDMLSTDRPIVSTAQGVRGLPRSVCQTIAVATDPVDFANQIIAALRAPAIDLEMRQAAREVFGVGALGTALEQCVGAREIA